MVPHKKKNKGLSTLDKMESNDSSETDTDENEVAEGSRVDRLSFDICACSDAGVIFHEHSYMKNYRELCEKYSKDCNINIVPTDLIQVEISLEEKEVCESVLQKLLKSKEVIDKRECHTCGNIVHPKFLTELSSEEKKNCETVLAKFLKEDKKMSESKDSCNIIYFHRGHAYNALDYADITLPTVEISVEDRSICESALKKFPASKKLTEVELSVCVEISAEEREICEAMMKNLNHSKQIIETEELGGKPKFLLNIEMSPKNKNIYRSIYKKVVQSPVKDTSCKCNQEYAKHFSMEKEMYKKSSESKELPEAVESCNIVLPGVETMSAKKELSLSKQLNEMEELCEAKKMCNFKETCGAKEFSGLEKSEVLEATKLCEAENLSKYKESCEFEKIPESEKLHEVLENIENCAIQMTVRRSSRQMSKIEKHTLATSGNSVSMEENRRKEPVGSTDVINKTKQENNNANGETINNVGEIHVKNACNLQSSARKNIKRLKLQNWKDESNDFNSNSMKNSMEDFITLEDDDNKKKIDLSTKSKRKRTLSEPSKSDSSSPVVEFIEKEKMKTKKLKSLVKYLKNTKPSEEVTKSNNVKRRKRNLSAPSDKSLKDLSKNSMKSLEISNKKRKKCLSLSEDSNHLAKNDIKKPSLSESKHEEIDLTTSSPVVKQKTKKKSKDSLRYIIDDNEPALFSQPHVLIKAKTDDCMRKEFKHPTEDKRRQSPVKYSDKMPQVTDDASKLNICHTNPNPVHEKCLSDVNDYEIASQTTIFTGVTVSNDLTNETDKFESDNYCSNEDVDLKNSLQIENNDENVEKENKKNSEIETNETVPDISCSPINSSNLNIESSCDHPKDFNSDEILDSSGKVAKSIVEDLDCDKSIAERKPRRTIKKKEFFEDITSRNAAQAKKSSGKQKGTEKRTTKEESKQGKEETSTNTDMESEESEEDDPTKLWCICRQPHNDRFMIMCDHCEDWFHGNCVSITKQQGRKLEKLKKEWVCPNCLRKASEAVPAENSTEKKIEPEGKKVTVEKIVSEPKEVQPPIKSKNLSRSAKPELKSANDKQVSPSLNSSISTTSAPKTDKLVNSSPVNKKIVNKSSLSTSKGSESIPNVRKGLKEPIRKKQNCVSCQAVVQSVLSCYCSNKCIEKHANNCLTIMREEKEALKGSEFDSQRIIVLDRVKGNVIAGDNAPTASNIISWLKTNPSYMIALSSSASANSKSGSQKDDCPSLSKDKSEETEESKGIVRLNVRKTLKTILMDRIRNADDIHVLEDDVRRIAVKIEEQLNSVFKDNSFKYRAKYRSLMFNIKDPRNQGLFRKIVKGNIPPDKLVRMSPEELASRELAEWREKENQHLLDMIKRVQLEHQSGTGLLLKKTHKGEVEIQDDFDVIDDVPKILSKAPTIEPIEPEKPEPEKEIIKDTTSQHKSHLFDLNCKICTGKVMPGPVEDGTSKKVRVAHSISVDLSSSATSDPVEKSASKVGDEKSLDQDCRSVSSQRRHSKKPKVSLGENISPVWKGVIVMHDVPKIDVTAFKVSGDTESFNLAISGVLDVCGRIIPDQVWEYLSKIKQSGSKELIIIRFNPLCAGDVAAYNNFFEYLSKRRRYAVVNVDKHFSKGIKDFYILPLAATTPVPVVLIPFDGPGLPDQRCNTLLGVIVRYKGNESRHERKHNKPPEQEKSKEDVNKYYHSYSPPLETCVSTPPLVTIKVEVDSPSYSSSSPTPSILSEYGFYSPTMPAYPSNASSPVQSDTAHNSSYEKQSEIYERSYTPPLHLIIDLPKGTDEDKPYDPEQGILNISTESGNLNSSPKDSEQHVASTNLEKQKKFLDALKKQFEETDRKVNELKQLISRPDDSDVECHSTNNQALDINNVASTGMSSFLPENLQDLLNVVREKSFNKKKVASKGDIDMRIKSIFEGSFDNSNNHKVRVSDKLINLQDENNSCSAMPPPDDNNENTSNLPNKSDPRIKTRTSFQESFSEEAANLSLSNMSVSELVEKAKKELDEMDVVNKTQKDSPTQRKLPATKIDTLRSTCWSEFKEPPPPGIELPELTSTNSAFSSETISTSKPDNSISSSFSSPLVQEAQQIAPHFPLPSIAPAFPPPLLPGFPIQTPPPNLKSFPPPNVISPSFPPPPPPPPPLPPLPVVTKASDINSVSDSWSTWNISSQQSKDDTWQNSVPQWDENWKSTTESALVDCAESSSYYPPGASEFHKESFYRGESSTESRWNRSPRFGRNNWHKRPPRRGNWRGRRGPFYFNKNPRNG